MRHQEEKARTLDYGTPGQRRPFRWGRLLLIPIAVAACLIALDLIVGSVLHATKVRGFKPF